MTVREVIVSQIERVAREQDKVVGPLHDDTVLMETGLDSLCFAILVARLEDQWGVDPFSDAEIAHQPVTVGDLIGLYQSARARAS